MLRVGALTGEIASLPLVFGLGERVAGLEVRTDRLAADVGAVEAVVGEPAFGGEELHPALGVAHVGHHHAVPQREAEDHRVDHVGAVGALGERLHAAAGRPEEGAQ